MKIDTKKKVLDLKEKLKREVDRLNKEIQVLNRHIFTPDDVYNEDVSNRVEALEEKVKIFNSFVVGKSIDRAFKVLSSGNPQEIQDYLSYEFSTLPPVAQKIIFHNTTDLSINGFSIYENIYVTDGGFITHGNPPVSIWEMFKDVPEEVGDKLATKSIKNLIELGYWPAALSDFFPIYLKFKDKEYAQSTQHFFDDISKLASIESRNAPYISNYALKQMVVLYFNNQGWKYEENPYTTERLKTFYSQFKSVSDKSPALQERGLLNDPSVYKNFLTGKYAYENYLELISHEEIKKTFYQDMEINGLNIFLQMLESLPEKEQLPRLVEYVTDPLFNPLNEDNMYIFNFLKRYKDKEALLDFELTMPLFEKLALAGRPLVDCISTYTINAIPTRILKQSEDELFGIDREMLKTDSDYVKTVKFDVEKREKLKLMLIDYQTCGIIDWQTYDNVLAIVQKYNKNMTMEGLKQAVIDNKNLRSIMEYISSSSRDAFWTQQQGKDYPEDCRSSYTRYLYDFEVLFKKTRLQAMPSVAVFRSMTLKQKEKFNLKVWKQFASLPIFSQDINTEKALIEFVAVMGLFESDSNVEKRRQVAYKIATDYGEKFTVTEIIYSKLLVKIHNAIYGSGNPIPDFEGQHPTLNQVEDFIRDKYLSPCKIKLHRLRPGFSFAPEGFASLFEPNINGIINENILTELKKTTGSFGKRIGNYLSPYAKDGDVYRLKKDVVVPEDIAEYIKEEMTAEEYEHILNLAQNCNQELIFNPNDEVNRILSIARFINPIEEVEVDGYMPRPDLSQEERQKVLNAILNAGVNERLNYASAHRIFDGCLQEFNEEFYNMIAKNFGYILSNKEKQGHFKDIQRSFIAAKKYYMAHGNSNPSLIDLFTYLDKVPFKYEFGLDEFAQDVKNSGVKTQEVYNFYQDLLPKLQARKKTTIPRHQKTYVYTDNNGKQYRVMTKILRLDDPTTMLVGESKFTNCCQVYQNAGQECMEHASTSPNGGILAVYLINDEGVPEMMTQSWIWTRESKLCLDNVEATDLITAKRGDEKRLYQDIATYGIVEASKDLIETSREEIEKYIAEESTKVKRSTTLDNKQKEQKLDMLEELKQRQILKIVTVGEGCDDLNVAETFAKRELPELSQGPKGYEGYRDSGVLDNGDSKQHIIIKTEDEILPVDENYEDVAIYRDERRIMLKKGENIPHSLLKRITEIEALAHKKEMVNYTEEDEPVLEYVENLAQIYDCEVKDLTILAGEDWYYVYSDDGEKIEVYDFAKCEPRLEDEEDKQQQEMRQAFNTILAQSIVVKGGKCGRLKEIKAELREDTSYLLYLFQKHSGLVKQDGEDVKYKYGDSDNQEVVSETQQQQIMKNSRQIRQAGNKDIYMHKVSFVASDKTVQKAIDRNLQILEERGL